MPPETVLMIGVGYLAETGEDDSYTFEIFTSMDAALKFAQTFDPKKKLEFFVADFSTSEIFQEENGEWNYEDNANLMSCSRAVDYNLTGKL